MAVYTTIDDSEAHFQVKLYTGTGSSQALTFDGEEDMQPDFVWIKERDDTNWLVHSLSWLDDDGKVKMGTRPVHMNTLTNHVQPIPPKKRVY